MDQKKTTKLWINEKGKTSNRPDPGTTYFWQIPLFWRLQLAIWINIDSSGEDWTINSIATIINITINSISSIITIITIQEFLNTWIKKVKKVELKRRRKKPPKNDWTRNSSDMWGLFFQKPRSLNKKGQKVKRSKGQRSNEEKMELNSTLNVFSYVRTVL